MTTSHLLLEAVRTLENKQAQIDLIKDEVKAYKKKLRARGFDLTALAQVIKDRKLTDEDRREREGILQIYRAALGLLDGTELGDFARRRLDKQDRPADEEPPPSGDSPASSPPDAAAPPNLELARQSGRTAAQQGKRVVENPYPAGDPQRAAWDEGWCEEAGNDGMDIPKALQRSKPKKKED